MHLNLAGNSAIKALIEKAVTEHRVLTDALRALVDHFGYIDLTLVPFIASSFNLSRAEILGVISFYEDFRTQKPAKNVIRICQAEACQAVGAKTLLAKVKSFEATDDIELTAVSCLGLCACGPAILYNNIPHALVSESDLDVLLADINET